MIKLKSITEFIL